MTDSDYEFVGFVMLMICEAPFFIILCHLLKLKKRARQVSVVGTQTFTKTTTTKNKLFRFQFRISLYSDEALCSLKMLAEVRSEAMNGCIILQYTSTLPCTALHCTALHSTALHCTGWQAALNADKPT